MALYALADTHLSFSTHKPMDKFGSRWVGHAEKLEKNWRAVVSENDTVVLPGDISWGMNFEEAEADFAFLHSLPGRKIIGKGNHDYWWATMAKMTEFTARKHFNSLSFLYNNAYLADGYVVCGSRGWFVEEQLQKEREGADWTKLVAREVCRLTASIEAGRKLRGENAFPLLVYLHFPPVFRTFVCRELLDVLHRYEIRNVYYGHIHGVYDIPPTVTFEEIKMTVIAADHLQFVPLRTEP